VARILACALAAITLSAAPASAVWSQAATLAASANARYVTGAVNAQGDAALAWMQQAGAVTFVRVAVRRGAAGAWSEQALRFGRNLSVGQVTLAMAPSGEMAVAWVERDGNATPAVLAAHRTIAGTWSSVETVGRARPFAYSYPVLATSTGGTMALAWNSHTSSLPGMAVAWRSPGHAFGAPRAVPGGTLSEPTLQFDSAGTAYLAGTALCDDESQSHGVLLSAPAATRRFGAARTIAPRPATEVSFAVTGPARGVAAWVGAGCSTSEILSGPVRGAFVTAHAAGAPVTLDAAPGGSVRLISAPGGADAVWLGSPAVTVRTARAAAAASVFGPTQTLAAGGLMALAGDAGGDQLLQPVSGGPSQAAVVRPAGSQALDAAPITAPGTWTPTWIAAGTLTGRSLLAATEAAGPLRVATWHP
jgi:hypothetical protein